MRLLSIIVLFHLLLWTDNLKAQDQINELIETGANYFQNKEYDSAIEAFNRVIKLEANDSRIYSYLAYSWFSKLNFDSAVHYFDEAIELDENNAELYYLRGIAKTSLNIRTSLDACNDFNKAKSLGHSDPSMEQWISNCWKHVDVILSPEGLSDSTIIDRILEILPSGWSILEIKDSNSLGNSAINTDKLTKFHFSLINLEQQFIDSPYSATEPLIPEITVAIVDNEIEDEIRTYYEQASMNVKEGEVFASEIFKSKSLKYLVLCKWWSEHRFERVNNNELTDRYFKDKAEIIKQLKRFDWDI